MNPDYTIIELDDERIGEFLEPWGWERNPVINMGGWVNILRKRLLTTYGGVWADATVFPQVPLRAWLPDLMQSGYFAFSRPGSDRMISTWFMAATPPCPLLETWLDMLQIYWRWTRVDDIYFVCHYLFEVGYWAYPTIRRQWKNTPYLSADGSHRVQGQMLDRAALPELEEFIRNRRSPVHKLTWKADLPDDLTGTPLGMLLQRDRLSG